MSLWLVLGALTLTAVAAVIRPLLRQRSAAPPQRGAFDRAIYKDQLAELARDVERGVLDPDQAAAARLEIERRLLATEGADPEPGDSGASVAPVDGVTIVMLAASVSAGAFALYLALGSPTLRDAPFAARQGEATAEQEGARMQSDLLTSVTALEAKLREHTDDSQGWLLLARSQAVLERWADSAAAYRRAMALTGDAPEAAAGYGQMLVKTAEGMVTPAARDAFAKVLAADPGNVPARYYMALADAQAGKAQAAIDSWAKLLADAPPGAGWVAVVRQNIAETARSAGIGPPPEARQAGPQEADIAAASRMSPEERQTMIRGMVDGLAARLERNPDDAAGWRRLATAYRVLGEEQKAADAAARAAALQPNDVPGLIEQAHALLGTGGGRDPKAPLPEKFIDAMKQVETLDPKQPEALWYLGLAEAQHHRAAAAVDYWRRLLDVLKPGSDDYKMVQEAVEAVSRKD